MYTIIFKRVPFEVSAQSKNLLPNSISAPKIGDGYPNLPHNIKKSYTMMNYSEIKFPDNFAKGNKFSNIVIC